MVDDKSLNFREIKKPQQCNMIEYKKGYTCPDGIEKNYYNLINTVIDSSSNNKTYLKRAPSPNKGVYVDTLDDGGYVS